MPKCCPSKKKDGSCPYHVFCDVCKFTVVPHTHPSDFDAFIRDITKVDPMPKSEAKRRLNGLLDKAKSKAWLTGYAAAEENNNGT